MEEISISLKVTYRFNAIFIKILMKCFTKLKQIILKFVWSYKRPRIDKTILREKRKAGCIAITDFRQYYKATIIKIAQYWRKKAHIDQWDRIERPAVNLHT